MYQRNSHTLSRIRLLVNNLRYRLLEDIAIADACYELHGSNIEEIFQAGFLALMETSVELNTVKEDLTKKVLLQHKDLERLFYEFLEELIYLKDAELLIFKKCKLSVIKDDVTDTFKLKADLIGQEIEESVSTITDVKAITYYQFYIKQLDDGWESRITFDL